MKKIKLTFYGGVQTVTGANFLLETDAGKKILVDCGLTQGTDFADNSNHAPFSYDPTSVDYLIVTHSHIDHIGRIPKLVKDGFKGKILSTPATFDLSAVMFDDAVKVIGDEARHKGVLPLYEKTDVESTLSLWNSLPYHQVFDLEDGLSLRFKDSGHILGSAMAEISYGSKKIVLTGDLGNSPSLLLRDTEVIDNADYLVMESVYGDRNHETPEDRRLKLYNTLKEAIDKNMTILLPAFSLERTQVVLYELNGFIEKYGLPSVPVFLDSPLALRVTDVYKKYTDDFNDFAKKEILGGDNIFNFPKLKLTKRLEESMGIEKLPGSKIIIAGSGMSNGGRILRHEKHYLPSPNTLVILVGYQAVGTLGRQIQDGVKELTIDGETLTSRAKVIMINGYSSHKDSDHLLEFVAEDSKVLKKAFVVMGEPKTSLFLVQKLKDELGVDAIHPGLNDSFDLDFGE
ncbi:MAG: MBL fold metallo-hydrolase [bacterium]